MWFIVLLHPWDPWPVFYTLGLPEGRRSSDAGELPKKNTLHIEHGENLKSRINRN
jgi:hypothetical protein